jgi:hypothetical protein
MRVQHDFLADFRPRSTMEVSASSHSVWVMSFIGMIAGPLVAKRRRRRCGMSSKALPISSMFLGES